MSNNLPMAPIVFCDLFKESDDEEEEEKECKGEDCTSSDASKVSSFKQIFEVEKLRILDENFLIRQFSWHRANANQIWPGTFLLAEYLRDNVASYQNGPILELGAATGALSVYLRCPPRSFDVITSDIDDGGDVENNIAYNFELNGMKPPLHIPFTWGTPWNEAVGRVRNRILKNHKSLEQSLEISAALAMRFKYIIASDILLYVSCYPALVESLVYLFNLHGDYLEEFVMSWNRRIEEAQIFFNLMEQQGFSCFQHRRGLYIFKPKK